MNDTNFDKWNREFRNQNLFAFNNDRNALLWLKVRAISKKLPMEKFLEQNNIQLKSTKITEQNKELFEKLEINTEQSLNMLDNYLCNINNEWYREMGVNEEVLKSDLYHIDTYEWGGDQNNSLDKYLISRFVKVISSYNELQSKQIEIQANAWNYVRTSWYNNWTSYLIESIFKHHQKVISAIGEIKSVDFFINDIPIDLKVTFFPNQYMNDKLKAKLNGKSELSWLKQKAKENNIELSRAESLAVITEKISASGHDEILQELRDKRRDVIYDTQNNKNDLMTWLYANQGEMRFGAENRLFVVLIDSSDMSQSWKMKRAFEQIELTVNDYLNNFTNELLSRIDFAFKGSEYSSLADVIFVVRQMSKGLPRIVKQSIEKSRDSALLAVETYNKPAVKFKSGGYIVLMTIAWTSLFHAIFFREKIKPFYRKQGKKTFEKKDGDYCYWELKTCVKEYFKNDTNNPIRKNIEFFM